MAGLAATTSIFPPGLQATRNSTSVTPPTLSHRARKLYLNQTGYRSDQAKVATVILAEEAPTEADGPVTSVPSAVPWTFEVLSGDTEKVVLIGSLSPAFVDPLAGDQVCLADFSALRVPGCYRVRALGHRGDLFAVGPSVYAEPLRLAMRSYYGQRCGCEVDLGDGYRHSSCHEKSGFAASSGQTKDLKNHGGWHDAGDYGRYIVNSGVTCGTLLMAWELYPDALLALQLDLPESGKGLPDFLAEVQWNLKWMLSLQDSADGGVWHKQTSTHFCGMVMPQKDDLRSDIIGTGSEPYKSTCATADFAAVMALAARCFRPFDERFAALCLSAARQAFGWCQANPNVIFKNPPGISTGEYGDSHCADEVCWATAELFRTTMEPVFEEAFLAAVTPSIATLRVQPPSWNNVAPLALWSYWFACEARPERGAICAAIAQATQSAAARLMRQADKSGYGLTLGRRDFTWGSNGAAANQSLLLLIAERQQPGSGAREAALGNLHYLLGRNCFGTSWVTHVGVRPFLHPHHRPSAADGIAAPWPGLLSGGPNAGGGDDIAAHLPQSAPMRMWVDDERAYSLNEIAINWNAPLVLLLAAAQHGPAAA